MSQRGLRCAHVFSTFGAGGPQIRAVQLMGQLGALHQHVVMAMDGNTDAKAQLPAGVVCEWVPPPPKGGFVATVRAQRRWLAALRPDLVLTYNWGAIETVAAARWLGVPIVHHEDGFLPDEVQRRLWRRSFLRRCLLRKVPVIVPSLVLQRIATEEWRLPAANVKHLPNGVDLVRFRPAAAPAAAIVGMVGGLRPEKDHSTLLRALSQLPGPVRACVVGGGALAAALHTEALALGVAGRVQWVGPVTDTAPWYTTFSLFVLSSRTEQMPIAMLEAMAAGLPVVATDVGDVRAILPPSAAACIVPANDPAALAAAIGRVLADHPLAAQLGADNRARVTERYEAATCLQRFLDVYAAAIRT